MFIEFFRLCSTQSITAYNCRQNYCRISCQISIQFKHNLLDREETGTGCRLRQWRSNYGDAPRLPGAARNILLDYRKVFTMLSYINQLRLFCTTRLDKHGRVFLVRCWRFLSNVRYSTHIHTLDKSRIERYQKHTAIYYWLPCT